MALTDNILREFAKTVNETQSTETKQKYYGTAYIRDNRVYVSIDGSKQQTPAVATVGVKDGERVTIELADHKAYIVGTGDSEIREVSTVLEKEVTLPDGTVTIEEVIQKVLSTQMPAQLSIDELTSKLIATKVLNAETINTETIKADSGFFKAIETTALTADKLKAATADIGYLTVQDLEGDRATIKELVTDNATVNGLLEAQQGLIKELDAKKLSSDDANLKYASIDKLDADLANIKKTNTDDLNAMLANIQAMLGEYAKINELKATNAEIDNIKSDYVTTAVLKSDYLTSAEILATYATIDNIKTKYAEIDLANVEKASIGKVLADVGLISSAVIVDGHITGFLDAVEINANNISAGTLSVERLVISGSDKSIVYALNNSGKLESTEVDTINGDIITKRTISADHIIANSITSNELAAECVTAEKILSKSITADKLNVISLESIVAKIGNFTINKAIYSNNHSIYNSNVDGVYIGDDYIATGANGKAWIRKDGSVSFGNGSIIYDAKTDKVEVDADVIKMGSRSVALEDDINKLTFSSRNLFVNTLNPDVEKNKLPNIRKYYTVENLSDSFADYISTEQGLVMINPVVNDNIKTIAYIIYREASSEESDVFNQGSSYTISFRWNVIGNNDESISNVKLLLILFGDIKEVVKFESGTDITTGIYTTTFVYNENNSKDYEDYIEFLVVDKDADITNISDTSSINSIPDDISLTLSEMSLTESSKYVPYSPAPEDFESQIEDTNTKIDEISIGGRNIVLKSDEHYNTSEYRIMKGTLSTDWVPGKKYTISVYGTIQNGQKFRLYRDNDGWCDVDNLEFIEDGVYSLTFICPDSNEHVASNDEFSLWAWPYSANANSTITKIKIELGNKRTDWTAAPEDLETEIIETTQNITKIIDDQSTQIYNNKLRISDVNSLVSDLKTEVMNSNETINTELGELKTNIYEYQTTQEIKNGEIDQTVKAVSDNLEYANERIDIAWGEVLKFSEKVNNVETRAATMEASVDGFTKTFMSIERSTEVTDGLEKRINEMDTVTSYVHESIDGIEVGKSDSAYVALLKSDRLEFVPRDNKSAPVAYFANNQLYITHATVDDVLDIGNFRFLDEGKNGLSLVHI